MPRKKPTPIITHTETICYAIYYLEKEVNGWRESLADLPDAEERVSIICERQLKQLDALKQMYLFETGTEFC